MSMLKAIIGAEVSRAMVTRGTCSRIIAGVVGFLTCGCLRGGDCGPGEAVQGTTADFTSQTGDFTGFSVDPPTECRSGGHFIAINGKGAREFQFTAGPECSRAADGGSACAVAAENFFFDDVLASLRAAGVHTVSHGVRICSSTVPGGRYVQIVDWKQADRVVEVLAAKVVEWNLGERVGVLVESETISCPQ